MPDSTSPDSLSPDSLSRAPGAESSTAPDERAQKRLRRRRLALLIAGPLAVIIVAAFVYFTGGRYASTEDAYVGAGKVMVSADISGKVQEVAVREGQPVKVGDVLFQIDPEPYRIAVDQAQARVLAAEFNLNTAKANYRKAQEDIAQAVEEVAYNQREFDRYQALVAQRVVSQSSYDTARYNLAASRQKLAANRQQAEAALAALGGNPDLPLESYPDYQQAKAALEQAQRDLRQTTVRATIDGVVSLVDSVQPGSYLAAGTPAFALVSDTNVWVDANLKETDLTHVRPGQKVSVTIDTYPDHQWEGIVESIKPATGAEFSVLPAQNSSGNWVKVVQRIAVRVRLQQEPGAPILRSGMSAVVDIDTGRTRGLGSLFGGTAVAADSGS